MLIFLLRRIISAIPTLIGVAVIIFFLFHMVGGDPTYQMVGKSASQETINQIRHEYGFDQPLSVQFLRHMKEMFTLDFPRSYSTKRPIISMVKDGIVPSLSLTLPAFLITTFLSLILGLLVAYYRGKWVDKLTLFLCVVGMSFSVLAYILFGQKVLAYQLGWFEISGYESHFPAMISYLGLPVLIYVVVSLGFDVRFYRTALLEETQQDYVRTARAKGLSEPVVFFKHVFKNSMVPVLTNVIAEIPLLILGSFLLESFFGIPGIGRITIDAVNSSDFPVIKVMTMLQASLYIFSMIITDILYRWVDPRVSFE